MEQRGPHRFAGMLASVSGAGGGTGVPLATRRAEEAAAALTSLGLAAHGMRVHALAPGAVATHGQSDDEERREAWLTAISLARCGRPREIAVDGGYTIAGPRVTNLAARDGSC